MWCWRSRGAHAVSVGAGPRRKRGGSRQAGGVRVVEIAEDPSDFKLVYDPTHPDANAEGYVEMPNVDLIKEMSDAMAAIRRCRPTLLHLTS